MLGFEKSDGFFSVKELGHSGQRHVKVYYIYPDLPV